MERLKVIKLIEDKLNDKEYCKNINCGTVTSYMCILLENGYMQKDIELKSIKYGNSCYIKIYLVEELREDIKKQMSRCCGFYPTIFEITEKNNIATMSEINEETDKVFNEMFTIGDILKGNTIEMMEEARKIAVKNLKNKVNNNTEVHTCKT